MARRKIREYDSKRLLAANIEAASGGKTSYPFRCVQITPSTDMKKLLRENPWLGKGKLVAKPDMLFGKRGKSNLVLLDASWADVEKFVKQNMNKEVEVGKVKGALTHFIVEPFIPHKEEYYLSFTPEREDDVINFSDAGGMDIEANWDKMVHLKVPVGDELDVAELEEALKALPAEKRTKTAQFILAAFKVYKGLDFTLLEFNPFTFDEQGNPYPLDARGELDDTASFKDEKKWGDLEFPRPFGRKLYPEEEFISSLDENSGASLKLTILNPKGRIWTMVAGGGASVIYADTLVDLGMDGELANYGEYSGNPNTEETYQYAKTIIDLATRSGDGKSRALIIGGGIANFTDVASTFKGIITAIREYKDKMKKAGIRIYVRRGGPNYQAGLRMMRELGKETGIPVEAFGPETYMTKVVPMAMKYVKGG
jgi:ATP citrate (pro-S)-lyase